MPRHNSLQKLKTQKTTQRRNELDDLSDEDLTVLSAE